LRRRLARIDAPAALASLHRDAFEGYASLFGVPDGAGDVMAPGAFAKSLRGGIERIRMLYQHFAHEPLGVWENIREDSRGLHVRGRLTTDIERGRDVLALLRDGALNGLSIGFKTQRARRNPTTGARVLIEVELWEISVVTFPLLEGSAVTAIGAKSDELAQTIRKATAVMHTLPLRKGRNLRAHGASEFRGGVSLPGMTPPRNILCGAADVSTLPQGEGRWRVRSRAPK